MVYDVIWCAATKPYVPVLPKDKNIALDEDVVNSIYVYEQLVDFCKTATFQRVLKESIRYADPPCRIHFWQNEEGFEDITYLILPVVSESDDKIDTWDVYKGVNQDFFDSYDDLFEALDETRGFFETDILKRQQQIMKHIRSTERRSYYGK